MKNASKIIEVATAVSSVFVLEPFSQPDDVMGIALVYQKAFGGNPWNEGYVCPVCKTTFADDRSLWGYCTHCRDNIGYLVKTLRCWPIHKILTDFYQEMLKPGAVCLTMKNKCGIIAFAWGYEVEVDTSLDKYLEAPALSKLIKGSFLYLDECAVLPDWQGKGCGKALMEVFIGKAKETQYNVLLRTMKNSVMHKMVVKLGGKVVQDISRKRVIMLIGVK